MLNISTSSGEHSEEEVAGMLDISISRLHDLLDRNIFNDGTPRPPHLTFTDSDVLLLGFWRLTEPHPKVLRMPRRRG